MRLFKGHDIRQVPQKAKDQVPEEVKARAREMAKKELERKLNELEMSPHDARGYGKLLDAVQAHIATLMDVFESLSPTRPSLISRLSFVFQTWLPGRTSAFGSRGRLTASLMTVGSLKVLLVKHLFISGEEWRSQN